jgi:hypothetical protein
MLGRVDAARDAEDFLSGGNFFGVDEAVAMVGEAGSIFRAGERGEEHAARASMKVEDEVGADHGLAGFEIAGENFGEAGFDDDAYFQIGAMALEERKGGRGENAIAQGSQTDHGDPRTGRKAI